MSNAKNARNVISIIINSFLVLFFVLIFAFAPMTVSLLGMVNENEIKSMIGDSNLISEDNGFVVSAISSALSISSDTAKSLLQSDDVKNIITEILQDTAESVFSGSMLDKDTYKSDILDIAKNNSSGLSEVIKQLIPSKFAEKSVEEIARDIKEIAESDDFENRFVEYCGSEKVRPFVDGSVVTSVNERIKEELGEGSGDPDELAFVINESKWSVSDICEFVSGTVKRTVLAVFLITAFCLFGAMTALRLPTAKGMIWGASGLFASSAILFSETLIIRIISHIREFQCFQTVFDKVRKDLTFWGIATFVLSIAVFTAFVIIFNVLKKKKTELIEPDEE